MAKNYGVKATTVVTVRHPKNRMIVRPLSISLWYLKRDSEAALFRAPGNSKTHSVTFLVNGYPCKIDSISTDGTARFTRIK